MTEFLLHFSKSIDTPEVKDWKELFQASRKKKKIYTEATILSQLKLRGWEKKRTTGQFNMKKTTILYITTTGVPNYTKQK